MRKSTFWQSDHSSIGDLILEGFVRASGVNVRVLRDDGTVTMVGEGDRCVVTVGWFGREPEHYRVLRECERSVVIEAGAALTLHSRVSLTFGGGQLAHYLLHHP